MAKALHTVVETAEFIRRAAGLLDVEQRRALIDYLAASPDAGDPMVGTGGARKLRWSAKGALETPAERNDLKSILTAVVTEYRKGSSELVEGRRKHTARRP